jgi:heptosyltransferase-3
MRILLIKPKHIGDSLVLTPTIVAIKRARPDAKIWVVVRRGCEGILAGCPEIDRVLTVAAVEQEDRRPGDFWRGLGTLLWLLSVRFDEVFELGDGHRARLLAFIARARTRYSVKPATPLKPREERRFDGISGFDWEARHRVEKDFYSVSEFFPLAQPIPPLRFDPARTRDWLPAANLTRFCVMQIGKRQSAGRWNREGWEEVGRWLIEHVGAIVITSGGRNAEVEEACWLQERLGPCVLATQGEADWPQIAGLLCRAQLYVGLDTATMHLAAACGCPAVALFGSTYEGNWRPWQVPHRIVADSDVAPTENGTADLARAKRRSMMGISADKVIAACAELLLEAKTNLRHP